MKFLLILSILLASCSPQNLNEVDGFIFKSKPNKITARITYYSIGEDKWGDLTACPNTPRAKEGITVAAHPNFNFGTKVYIPDLKDAIGNGVFVVQDRGSAVTKKKAARGKAYVFDVFVKNQYRMNKHAYNRPMYMDVYIIE